MLQYPAGTDLDGLLSARDNTGPTIVVQPAEDVRMLVALFLRQLILVP